MASQRVGGTFLFATLLSMAFAIQAAADVRVYVRTAPPPPIRETITVSPGPGYVWVPGYHAWRNEAHVWVAGRWEQAPHAHARWNAGRWSHDRSRGWYWTDGRWR